MDHLAHVGVVNAHAEGVSGSDDGRRPIDEPFFNLAHGLRRAIPRDSAPR